MPKGRSYGRKRRRRGRYRGRRTFSGVRSYRGRHDVSTYGSTIQVRQTGGNLAKTSSLRLYQPSTVPDNIFVKLKYADQKIVMPAGATEEIIHNGNGLVDPNGTKIGADNPMGFIEWMAFYGRYECFGSKCEFLLTNTSQSIGIWYALYPSFGTTTIADYPSNSVQPYAISGVVGQEPSGNNLAHISAYMSTKKLMGHQLHDDSFTGTVSTNPFRLWFWTLFVISQGGSLPPLFTFQVKITYYAKLFDRLKLIQEASPAIRLAALERAKRAGALVSASEMNLISDKSSSNLHRMRITKPMPISAYRLSDLPVMSDKNKA